MYGLYFTYANINVDESIDYYLSNKEKIAKNLSKGILQYFRVEKQEK